MILRKNSLIFLLFTSIFTVKAQKVELVKLPQLEQIIDSQAAKVVVINFWATWCKPCVEELPSFQKVARKYPEVKVLLVSLDPLTNTTAKVRPFLKSRGIATKVYVLYEARPEEWIDKVDSKWSGAIPATLIISKKNNRRLFLERELTMEQLEECIMPLLK